MTILQNHEVEQLLQHALTNGQSQNPALLALNHHFNAQQQSIGNSQFSAAVGPSLSNGHGHSLNPSADPWLPTSSRQSSRFSAFLDQPSSFNLA